MIARLRVASIFWLCLVMALSLPAVGTAQGFLDSLGGPLGGGLGGANRGPEVEASAQFTPATAERPAVLMITATIAPGWHVYSTTQGKLPNGFGPQETSIAVAGSEQFRLIGNFLATPAPSKRIDQEAFVGLPLEEHADLVTWYAPIEISTGVDPNQLKIPIQVRLQACEEQGGCVPFKFDLQASLGSGVEIGPLDLSSVPTAPQSAAGTAQPTQPSIQARADGKQYDLSAIQFGQSTTDTSLGWNLLLAFGGGLILNLMPCVLPVIGLKVMSFVQQAGQSRAKAFELNLWYSIGIMSVFWILAGLAIVAGVSWGEQFSSVGFNVVMASIVFVMALSMLGVWEIHVPSAVGQTSTHQAVSGEGRTAALLKGVLTTLLATPCTGPGMAVALGWAVKQSSPTIFMVFTALGLGMASPYLLIGAFPKLVSFLPKPGNWMVTFKELMGFVLMGTVIFLLSLLPSNYLLPAICLMTTLGVAAWVYAKLPLGSPWSEHTQTYALCGAIVAAGAVFAFGWLAPMLEDQETHWQDFSLAALHQSAVEEGKTVLVDFGADWCANCQVLEKNVLHTQPVEEAIQRNNVVPMFGDNTYYPPEIEATLSALQSNGVPVIAIFPGGAPYQPIVFRGFYTQQQLLDAIDQAVGVQATPVARTAANP